MSEEKNLQNRELEQVSGGEEKFGGYCYCPNPNCWNHKQKYHAYPEHCLSCGAKMVWVNEAL